MITITCDGCGSKIESNETVRVEFRDGEHPHCGSTMHKTVDICFDCIRDIKDLSSNMEFYDFEKQQKKG